MVCLLFNASFDVGGFLTINPVQYEAFVERFNLIEGLEGSPIKALLPNLRTMCNINEMTAENRTTLVQNVLLGHASKKWEERFPDRTSREAQWWRPSIKRDNSSLDDIIADLKQKINGKIDDPNLEYKEDRIQVLDEEVACFKLGLDAMFLQMLRVTCTNVALYNYLASKPTDGIGFHMLLRDISFALRFRDPIIDKIWAAMLGTELVKPIIAGFDRSQYKETVLDPMLKDICGKQLVIGCGTFSNDLAYMMEFPHQKPLGGFHRFYPCVDRWKENHGRYTGLVSIALNPAEPANIIADINDIWPALKAQECTVSVNESGIELS